LHKCKKSVKLDHYWEGEGRTQIIFSANKTRTHQEMR